MIALVAGTACAAFGAPRESVTFTNVDSVGWVTDAANQVRTVTFNGSDGGGTYTARYLTVSGTVTDTSLSGTWAREAVIEITPPNGQSFVCIPITTGGYVGSLPIPAGRYVVPIGTFDTAGVWTFKFAETYDDTNPGEVDQTWSSITFTLDDAPPPATVVPSPGVTVAFSNVNSDGTQGAGSTVLTSTITDTGLINGIQVVGRATTKSLVSADNLDAVPNQARIRITPPISTGLAAFTVVPPLGGVSTGTCNISVSIPGAPAAGVPVTGQWTFEFYELTDEPTGVDGVWQNVSFTFVNSTPPVATNFPALVDGGATVEESDFVTAPVITAPNTVSWLKIVFPTAINSGLGSAMDIDMATSNGLPENDFSMGLYNSSGVRVANSFNTGPGLLPQISLGAGTRTRNGDGIPYDGQNPGASPNGGTNVNAWPAAPAGDYYLAVCSGDDGTAFGPGLWSVVGSTEANTPGVVRVRYYSNAPAVTPAVVQNLGSLPSLVTGVANMPADAGARFKWIKFSIPTDANDTTNKYVDIDTANSLDPVNDTNIALYDSAGNLMSLNDDIAPGWGVDNPTGGNAAMSFGTGNFSRDYSSVNTNLPAGDGRDGYLPAGTYYLQVSMCCAGYGDNRFWVVNDYVTNLDVGDVNWAIRSNYTGCGPADVGQQGGIEGSDEHLDNNDFVVFIGLFFTQSPLADMGKQGGVAGSDGTWDNNDFIVFIDQFFNAPSYCR